MRKSDNLILGVSVLCLLFLGINSVNAAVSKEDPYHTVGTDFLVINYGSGYDPVLYVIFNNTQVYVDIENDGIWELQVVKNAGESLVVSIPTQSLRYGTRIHTDKPVINMQNFYYGYSYYSTPPISSLRSSYYVYGGAWYAVVPENAVINVDNNDDGTVDSSINATSMTLNSVSVSNFARVFSDKSFYLYYYTFAAQGGTDFYLPWATVRRIIVTQNNTEVKVDTNNDGFYDGGTVTWNKGDITSFSGLTFKEGAHMRSDKPIVVYLYHGSNSDSYTYPLQPSDKIGNDMWSIGSGSYYYITGLFNNLTSMADNTTYYVDRATENDLIPNSADTVNSNQYKSLPDLGMVHIWANMPFMESYYNNYYYYGYYYYYYLFPYSTISATQYGTQKYLGANEITTIQLRVFNPFANTTALNVSLTARFPSNFSMPDGNNVTLNIERRYLRNDTLIETSDVVLTPSLSGGNYVFNLSLDFLDPMQYYNIGYELVTPSDVGSFRFDPVALDFEAETWNMPQ